VPPPLSIEAILLAASVLLLLSILASKASGRLGVPALLLFLVIGMLAGSDGPGGIYFDDPWLTQLVGVVALAFILFDGGLSTRWSAIRPVLLRGVALSSLGVLLTMLLVGAFARLLLDFSWIEALLLGAIVSSTDAAAVFSVLRSRDVSLKGDLEPLLELESGSNDPMAVFLTVGLTGLLVDGSGSIAALVPMFFRQMIFGALIGVALGLLMVFVINRIRLGYEGLYPVLTLAFVLLVYATASARVVGGNGFLAVYLAGLVMGNRVFIHRRSLVRFHDGLSWLMQIAMFLALGLLVFPTRLVFVAGAGLLISAFLILVARPASVFLTLLFARMDVREKAMVSWVGLRGAAPIILATFPLLAGIPRSEIIFNLVFFIVLTSVLLQGTLIPPVARLLKVDAPLKTRPALPLELAQTASLDSDLVEIDVPDGAPIAGKRIMDLGLPDGALVVLLKKGERFFVPGGGTVLESGDRLTVLAGHDILEDVRSILANSRK
jgi:potassium/hydrogen antiporter